MKSKIRKEEREYKRREKQRQVNVFLFIYSLSFASNHHEEARCFSGIFDYSEYLNSTCCNRQAEIRAKQTQT